ncbi:substrate-binding domain-containing protein, partial [Lysobacter sp. 2RAB21]
MIRLMRNALLAFAVFALASCGGGGGGSNAGDDSRPAADAFTVLAGSELKDVETQLSEDIRKATGVKLHFTYAGTLDAIDRLNAGENFDAVWVSHGKYLAMNPALKQRLLAQDKVMLSPVVLGVKASKARELGWDTSEPTWKD